MTLMRTQEYDDLRNTFVSKLCNGRTYSVPMTDDFNSALILYMSKSNHYLVRSTLYRTTKKKMTLFVFRRAKMLVEYKYGSKEAWLCMPRAVDKDFKLRLIAYLMSRDAETAKLVKAAENRRDVEVIAWGFELYCDEGADVPFSKWFRLWHEANSQHLPK